MLKSIAVRLSFKKQLLIIQGEDIMKSGDLEFQQIFNEYQPRILQYLTRLTDKYEAEDLSQDVFIKVEKGLKNFRGESKLSTWIYRIATNTAIDRMRNPSIKYEMNEGISTKQEQVDEFNTEDQDLYTGERAESTDQQFVREEMNSCIRSFIEKLPDNYRAVIILSELEGLKNKDIAEILKISLDTVKIRLHRARGQLRKKLESNCSFYRSDKNELSCDLKDEYAEFRKDY
jgi:RNA polymerase sigma-70 factor (ECF subfamily)